MISQLKIKKLGNFYEILAIKVKEPNFNTHKININQEKNATNLIRAKNTIQELALCNDFRYFFTLTFNPTYDRYNFFEIINSFRKVLRYIREYLKIKLNYLVVPEQHKNGAWHLHGFFDKQIEKLFYLNKNGYFSLKEFDKLGYQSIQPINDLRRASSYVTKYVSKNLGKGFKLYKHTYFASKGLKRGEEVYSKIYNNEHFNANFFDYSNDYCYKKIITSEEFAYYKGCFALL